MKHEMPYCIDPLYVPIKTIVGAQEPRIFLHDKLPVGFIGPQTILPCWVQPLPRLTPVDKVRWQLRSVPKLVNDLWDFHFRLLSLVRGVVILHQWHRSKFAADCSYLLWLRRAEKSVEFDWRSS